MIRSISLKKKPQFCIKKTILFGVMLFIVCVFYLILYSFLKQSVESLAYQMIVIYLIVIMSLFSKIMSYTTFDFKKKILFHSFSLAFMGLILYACYSIDTNFPLESKKIFSVARLACIYVFFFLAFHAFKQQLLKK